MSEPKGLFRRPGEAAGDGSTLVKGGLGDQLHALDRGEEELRSDSDWPTDLQLDQRIHVRSAKSSTNGSSENIARHPPLPMYHPASSPDPSSVRSTSLPAPVMNFTLSKP